MHLAFAELRTRLQGLSLRYGLFEAHERELFFPTMEAVLAAIAAIADAPDDQTPDDQTPDDQAPDDHAAPDP